MRAGFPLLAVLFAGCGEASNLIDYGVYGYVREAASGDGVSGVEVTFRSDTLRRGRDESDSDGQYEIVVESDTPFGHLTAVDPDGRYATKVVEVYFDEDTRRVDIDLGPAPAE